jgi:hypothetical protein
MRKPTKKTPTRTKLPAAPAEGASVARSLADLATAGVGGNAYTLQVYGHGTFGELDMAACLDSLRDTTRAVQGGDLRHAEGMLVAQAVALNAMFGEMARRASVNMGEYLGATETYLKLALKAQAQCRATLETLALLKNPPVFARQANIAHGPQQVNNGPAPQSAPAAAHAGESAGLRNELLEGEHGERLDTGAAGAASGGDPQLAPVGAVNRPANG